MIKKLVTLTLLMLSTQTVVQVKSWITEIRNDSPFYVKFQSNDRTAGNVINGCKINKDTFVVGPESSVRTEEMPIPWYSVVGATLNEMIKLTVNGVDNSGRPFIVTQASLQEINGDILLDKGNLNREKIERAFTFALVIDKKGTISLQKK